MSEDDVEGRWLRDGTEIRLSGERRFSYVAIRKLHRLTVAETYRGDAGEYAFVAGKNSSAVSLHVQGKRGLWDARGSWMGSWIPIALFLSLVPGWMKLVEKPSSEDAAYRILDPFFCFVLVSHELRMPLNGKTQTCLRRLERAQKDGLLGQSEKRNGCRRFDILFGEGEEPGSKRARCPGCARPAHLTALPPSLLVSVPSPRTPSGASAHAGSDGDSGPIGSLLGAGERAAPASGDLVPGLPGSDRRRRLQVPARPRRAHAAADGGFAGGRRHLQLPGQKRLWGGHLLGVARRGRFVRRSPLKWIDPA